MKDATPALLLLVLLALAAVGPSVGAAAGLPPHQQLARDIYQQLVETDTTEESGSTTACAESLAARFRAAGFPAADVFVGGPAARKGNLVVRYRGRGAASALPSRGPLLLLAHLDVVAAKRADWSKDLDPFRLTERDGFFYGRGTSDDKSMAAIFAANLLRLKQQGSVPARDIIMALTADEEGGNDNGADWLLAHKPELVSAAYGLNEGGDGQEKGGRKVSHLVQASEKVYVDFTLEVQSPGGHSSQPQRENAIYLLADALSRIGKYEFPVRLSEITRAYFERMARVERGPLAADFRAISLPTPEAAAVARLVQTPYYNALLRTTCVATVVHAGHAHNALPQRATANVNCRLLPDEDPAQVQRTLVRIIDQPKVTVRAPEFARPSAPSPLLPEVMGPIEQITQQMWPGVPVVPIMGTGATDSLFFRQHGIPMYGVSGLFGDMDDNREHGRDERMGVKEFYEGQEFLWRLVNALSGVLPR